MPQFRPEDLAAWAQGEWSAHPQRQVNGVSHDTRSLHEGDLYIAIRGKQFDGHDFVDQAFRLGAAAALVAGDYEQKDVPLLRVDDPRRALGLIARGHRRRLSGIVCAITGSVGKTTVKEMLAGILSRSWPTAATQGNWNNDIGLPLSLLAMDAEDRFGVFEVAMNRPGEIAYLSDILKPDCGIMTTIGLAHGEHFDGVEGIAREKANMLAAISGNGFAVLSADEDWFELFHGIGAARVVSAAFDDGADYVARRDGRRGLSVEGPLGSLSCRLPMSGEHIMRDALLAVAAAKELGAGDGDIIAGLQSFAPLPMRGQISDVAGVLFVNDAYNANPVSLCSAVKAFAELECTGRRWLVVGGMNELGRTSDAAHCEVGGCLPGRTEFVVAVGPGGRKIAAGAVDAGFDSDAVFPCSNAEEAAEILVRSARPGDNVLLKASRTIALERVVDIFGVNDGEGNE